MNERVGFRTPQVSQVNRQAKKRRLAELYIQFIITFVRYTYNNDHHLGTLRSYQL